MAALNAAIKEKRFAQVKLLLDSGINVNKRDAEMRTALMQICFLEDETQATKYAKKLLKRGAKVDLKDKNGLNAFSLACKLGQEQLVSIILEETNDFDLNAQDKQGNTALHYAAMSGNFVVLNLLLNKLKKFRLSVDKLNNKGETPLIVASKSGNFFCARILESEGKASKGARDYVEFKTAEEWGRTKESLRSASKSPLFRIMQFQHRSSLDHQFTGSLNSHTKQNFSQRPNTAPGNLLNQSSEKNHRENLQELYRVYEGQVSEAFRHGVKPTPTKSLSESMSSLTESTSRDPEFGDELCSLYTPVMSPVSCQLTRRFILNKTSKLAFNSNAAFRRASIATTSTASTNKSFQRRGSQSSATGGRRLSLTASVPLPRIRRGSMNVMSKITKIAVTSIKRETAEEKGASSGKNISTGLDCGPARDSVTTDRLMVKLQTLAEESGSEEEEEEEESTAEEILQRSSPANLFLQL